MPSPDPRPPLPSPLTPGLRRLLALVLLLSGLILVDSLYLVAVEAAEAASGRSLQNTYYLYGFLAHLVLGLLLVVPALLFGALHLRRARHRPNRYAVRAGLALYACVFLLFASGILLTRFGFFAIDDPQVRAIAYWIHVLTPLAVLWLFVLHRLAGPPLAWRSGMAWGLAAVAVTATALPWHLQGDTATPLVRAFSPALSSTPEGRPIAASHLMADEACAECHPDVAAQHAGSMHRLSSFNNPAYRFAIEDTRARLTARDGDPEASRLCAACHDQVPLFSGRFDDPDYDADADPGAQAGIGCLGCHAITTVDSPRGNGDYGIAAPPRYPFAASDNGFLQAVSRQLIKAKPGFHKATMLKPVHKDASFCSACHKVHLPVELNHYRWLRGQNHYHHHGFAAANTAVPQMLGMPADANDGRFETLGRAARVDLFGLREGATTEGPLHAPLRPRVPMLAPGGTYLLEVVVRTLGVGHALTQGTADSNELWLELTVSADDGRTIGRSGALNDRGAVQGDVDPWAYFLNAYLLDRDGNRIDRRNAQDIFVALYDHQIPPGAAATVHYRLTVPLDAQGPLRIDARLCYRKFDTRFYRHVLGERFVANDLPIATLATDSVTLPLAGGTPVPPAPKQASAIPAWERWNDYGIGLLLQGSRGESSQAEAAFAQVEAAGRALGALNLARVLYREGRLDETAAALARAARSDWPDGGPAPPWTVAWFSALVERDRGNLDGAIGHLEDLAATRFEEARSRGFDFGYDYRMQTELGRVLYERARRERGAGAHRGRSEARVALLERARDRLAQALALEPEYAASHHNLSLVYAELGDAERSDEHRRLHEQYRTDDNAVATAVSRHRSRHPAADHAAEPVAIYDLTPGSEPAVAAAPDGRLARQ